MRRPALLVLWVLELWLAVALALAALAWIWSGSPGSLAQALQWASRLLPADQRLQATDVTGSLRAGGRILALRWSQGDLVVDARDIDLRWEPEALWSGRLQVPRLHVADLRVEDRRPASDAPLPELVLPLQVDIAWEVDRLRWDGPPALEVQGLRAQYVHDGTQHLLRIAQARIAQGQYQAEVRLQARAPMALALEARGRVTVPVGAVAMPLDFHGTLQGALAARDATLQLAAQLQPAPGGAIAAAVAPRAQVTASLQPWARQPVLQAQARVQQLDLAPLWPGAPRTRLQGDAQVRPQGERWQALLQLENTLPGPWNEQTLPVRQARASVVYAQGAWTIESLQALGAGGSLGLQGRVGAPVAGGPGPSWTARAQWTGINPALADSRLAPAALAGSGDAGFDGSTWTFTVSLQPGGPQPAASPLAGLRLQRASAHGSWGAGWLRLPELQLQTDDASLQGQLEIQPASRSGQGRLQLRLPGGQGRLEGQMAPRTGSGTLTLDIADAAQAGAWLRRLPVAGVAAALPALRGQGDLAVDWQGGWQDLQAGPDGSTRVQARLRVPALALQSAGADPAQLRDADIRVAGTLAAWSGSASGRLQRGPQQLLLASQVRGGRAPDGLLQLTIDRAQANLDDSRQPGHWSLSLQAPLPMQWQTGRLQTAPAQARLSGPLPGSATLQLDAIRWSPGAPGQLVSQGQLRDLPLAWLTRLGDLPLERLGLSGNLVFDANWDLSLADTLRLRASLARRSGDIRVLAERLPGSLDPGTAVDAGVRDARIDLRIDGETVNSTVRWDSERAGSVQAEFGTRLVRDAAGWDWPLAAPLNGSVQARLPQVGVWSLLAPPGWRMRGTLDAGLTLAGTRQAPDWSGRLQADGLALRSVVDGIEFGNGRLRARMQGQRLFIEEFLLQGAGVAAGGTLSATGHAQWVPGSDSEGGTLSRIQIDLDAQAQALRVSARADRRLVVSGQLQARLRSNRLDVQGRLQADQALFVLPDETAPRLGDDVVIATRAAPAGAEAATPRSPADTPGAGVPVQTTLALALALGPDFRVQGRGIVTRLAGTLQLRAAAGELPQLQGEVRTVRGSYKAYGQLLDIEQGVLRFTGRYDNPALDILAVRPNLTQRVGVQITGTAAVPRVRLFSEPEMAEAEKLAWLVLGRSGANGGAEAAVLQQAALALLGRNGQGLSGGLATALGLDELSIAAAATRADGSTSAATVTLGKRLSRDFYVAYERSLAGTLGTISIFYDLSRRFTLRASTGEQSAIDLIFTLRYD